MEDIKIEDISPSENVEETEVKTEVEQDPLKPELDRVQTKRTKLEKLAYTKNRIEQQIRDEQLAQGIEPSPDSTDDDSPVTVGMLKKLQSDNTTKTALQFADDISNETERELVKFHINNTIRSTGNSQEDYRLALAIVNAAKNKQILEAVTLKPGAKRASSNGGATPQLEEEPEFTREEESFMRPPWNLTKQQILDARKKAQ